MSNGHYDGDIDIVVKENSSVKFYENALTALKKANAARKMVLAGKAGYSSVEEYKSFICLLFITLIVSECNKDFICCIV